MGGRATGLRNRVPLSGKYPKENDRSLLPSTLSNSMRASWERCQVRCGSVSRELKIETFSGRRQIQLDVTS